MKSVQNYRMRAVWKRATHTCAFIPLCTLPPEQMCHGMDRGRGGGASFPLVWTIEEESSSCFFRCEGEGRDFLLPTFDRAGTSTTGMVADYSSMSTMAEELARDLRKPVWKEGEWMDGEELLLPPELHNFWTMHAERNFIPSALAVLLCDQGQIDLFGRWSPQGSAEYVRSYRVVVRTLQEKLVTEILRGNSVLVEHDVIDRMTRFCAERFPGAEARCMQVMSDWAFTQKSFYEP